MKVLEIGGPWKGVRVCTGEGETESGCRAELEVEQSDLFRVTHSGDWDPSRNRYADDTYHAVFECPLCGSHTVTKAEGVWANALPSYGAWKMAKGSGT